MKRVIHENKDAGIKQYFHMDDDGNIGIETKQDVEHILDDNKDLYNQIDANQRWGDMQRVASIPLSIYYSPEFQRLLSEQKAGNDKPLRAWLNNPDNRFFRTRGGVV